MTRTTPNLAPSLQTSTPHQQEDDWPPKYDLTCNRPNTERIFSGIGFQTKSPPTPKSRPFHWVTAPSKKNEERLCQVCETVPTLVSQGRNPAVHNYDANCCRPGKHLAFKVIQQSESARDFIKPCWYIRIPSSKIPPYSMV
ncbi:hypothetical protein AVEN_106317-1 [Araneus ventricosus]|uniref:Uncharacterized protein n=1 Tax=Araneus ventricosus TaxID=182803 RepID=A0A4Y2ATD8_ARAVE|nr:hypothetical protein AVEN_106317-1 [Araneus ventricosus]